MNTLIEIFGKGQDLNTWQMSARGIAVLLIALILVRISGRRSFGLHMPLDNIVTISLGAILSRTVVGASPFVPVIATCFVIVITHRVLAWLVSRSQGFANITEGNKMLLFSDGHFNRQNIRKALVSEEDVMQGVRESASTDDMSKIDRVYMERNGQISVVKKKS